MDLLDLRGCNSCWLVGYGHRDALRRCPPESVSVCVLLENVFIQMEIETGFGMLPAM